ncbi:uncharacterized protein C19orf18 homolog [Acomys russatus]|uniref:uncharacterized protein C19orf18 homolog n=1 Tax=Acomys russatus TaxID=60746 RepID=UPI0021E2EBC5|nr:uncharacterized protein C19orf18 homolog [Acomys russatus]
MDKVHSSSLFLFWFLLECLLRVCLPYEIEETRGSPGSRQLKTQRAPMEQQPRGKLSMFAPAVVHQEATSKSLHSLLRSIIPRRPGLVHVISVSSIAFAIALLCGLILSYLIYRLVKAEEKQQLATLYENVEIPLLDEKEASEDEYKDESSQLHPENEELGKFIGSGALSCVDARL